MILCLQNTMIPWYNFFTQLMKMQYYRKLKKIRELKDEQPFLSTNHLILFGYALLKHYAGYIQVASTSIWLQF